MLPQDVLVAVRLLKAGPKWTFESLGADVGISASQCHMSVGRLVNSRLVDEQTMVTIKGSLLEFLVHGVKYVFPCRPKDEHEIVLGLPTAHSHPIWKGRLVSPTQEKFVWEHPGGKTRGKKVTPIYKTVPDAAKDKDICQIFAVLDSIRLGHARERDEAESLLKKLIYETN